MLKRYEGVAPYCESSLKRFWFASDSWGLLSDSASKAESPTSDCAPEEEAVNGGRLYLFDSPPRDTGCVTEPFSLPGSNGKSPADHDGSEPADAIYQSLSVGVKNSLVGLDDSLSSPN